MVYVNSKKFACESCIKGHRSSSCHHTDRPLFEIKKKGRPISQCEKCRELRQSKKVHSKCTCNGNEEGSSRNPVKKMSSSTKPKRLIPVVPALPNGLQDMLFTSPISSTLPANSRQRVDALLNPCHCRSVWKCNCQAPRAKIQERGMDPLVDAAAIYESEASTSALLLSAQSRRKSANRTSPHPEIPVNNTRTKDICKAIAHLPGPELPPISLRTSLSSTTCIPIPTFETMPPMSIVTSLAGSGCTCGFQCACPGCLEHRGQEHASKERKDCADGCGTCIDHNIEITLPNDVTPTNNVPSFLDQFFARAAALPIPPANRRVRCGIDLDPMNLVVYPDIARDTVGRGLAFGLVNVPKLECCGGRCACPGGVCGCGKSCDGCCTTHQDEGIEFHPESVDKGVSTTTDLSPLKPTSRGCCVGKPATVKV